MRAKIEMAIAFAAMVIAAVLGSVVGYVLYTTP
jgi:ABC-type sulfate transport system permease component